MPNFYAIFVKFFEICKFSSVDLDKDMRGCKGKCREKVGRISRVLPGMTVADRRSFSCPALLLLSF
jgi:hypothetical protein